MRNWKRVLAALALVVVVYGAYLYSQLRDLEVELLSDDLLVLRGIGGNSTVLKTTSGNVIIDSMTFPMQGRLIRARARDITGQDTAVLINTHYHLDHTHGNPGFGPETRVIATQRTLDHLKFFDAEFWEGEDRLAPSETFDQSMRLEIGGKSLLLLHPGRGHTDGDLVVIIEDENTAVMGDLMFHRQYPNIDLEAGGSVQRWPQTLDRVMLESFQQVIPGHGDTTNRVGLQNFRDFIAQLASIGLAAANQGDDLETTLATSALTRDEGYTEISFAGIPLGLDREFVLRRSWQEATGNFELKN